MLQGPVNVILESYLIIPMSYLLWVDSNQVELTDFLIDEKAKSDILRKDLLILYSSTLGTTLCNNCNSLREGKQQAPLQLTPSS